LALELLLLLLLLLELLTLVANGDGMRLVDVSAVVIHVSVELGC